MRLPGFSRSRGNSRTSQQQTSNNPLPMGLPGFRGRTTTTTSSSSQQQSDTSFPGDFTFTTFLRQQLDNPLPMGLPGFSENSIINIQQTDSSLSTTTTPFIPELRETTSSLSNNSLPMIPSSSLPSNTPSPSSILGFGDISTTSSQQQQQSNLSFTFNDIKPQNKTESGSDWAFTSSNTNIAEADEFFASDIITGVEKQYDETQTERDQENSDNGKNSTELFSSKNILMEDFEDEDEQDDRIVIENHESEDSETDDEEEENSLTQITNEHISRKDEYIFRGSLPSPNIIPLVDTPEYLNDPRFNENNVSPSRFVRSTSPEYNISGAATSSLPTPPTTAALLSQMQREAKPEDFIPGSTTSVSSSGPTSTLPFASSSRILPNASVVVVTRVAEHLSLTEYSYLSRTCKTFYLHFQRELIHYLKNVYGLSVRSGSLVLFAYTAHLQYRAPRLLDRIFDEFFIDTVDSQVPPPPSPVTDDLDDDDDEMAVDFSDPNWPMYWSVLYSLDKQPNYLPPAMLDSEVENEQMPNPKVQFLEKYASRMNAKFASRNGGGGGRVVGGLGASNNRGRRHQDWHLADIRQKKTYRMLIMQNIRYGDVDLLKFYLERYGPPINSVVRMTAEEQIFLQQNCDLSTLLTKHGIRIVLAD
ncbi:11110_t:CDS:2 [Ambispora gerdemannii]|uniref:11110_t:CDS:1 n=1 Tax=Ambispora gerdemannii TaxID=144530 RepID=A0A9N9BKA7_9GLOM|nr:11110_t:CDS:2 [Ambispora gerdemannii]